MKTSEALEKAWALIDSPDKWTQQAFARDERGTPFYVSPAGTLEGDYIGPGPACFCAKGAVRYACKDMTIAMQAEKALNNVMWAVAGQQSPGTLLAFNDSHTHQELKEVWHIAIAKAKEQEDESHQATTD